MRVPWQDPMRQDLMRVAAACACAAWHQQVLAYCPLVTEAANQIRIRISCARLIRYWIAQEISEIILTPSMLNQSQLRMLNLQVTLI